MCILSTENYIQTEKNDFYLYVSKASNNYNELNYQSYKCYIQSEFSDYEYSKTFFKCSNKIIIVKNEFILSNKIQNTWVLIDKNENTFLLKEVDFYEQEYYQTNPTDCDHITHELNHKFEFDTTVNYSEKVTFHLKRLYQYESKKSSRPVPEF